LAVPVASGKRDCNSCGAGVAIRLESFSDLVGFAVEQQLVNEFGGHAIEAVRIGHALHDIAA
jgi:hypothetical protein